MDANSVGWGIACFGAFTCIAALGITLNQQHYKHKMISNQGSSVLSVIRHCPDHSGFAAGIGHIKGDISKIEGWCSTMTTDIKEILEGKKHAR
jgi:hypothetical protein